MSTVATPVRERFSFVKEGTACPWYEKPKDQVSAIARKHFGCSYQLWKFLTGQGKIRSQRQVLDETTRTWRHA